MMIPLTQVQIGYDKRSVNIDMPILLRVDCIVAVYDFQYWRSVHFETAARAREQIHVKETIEEIRALIAA